MKVGTHAFDGAFSPSKKKRYSHITTFSVGVFEWIPTKDGKDVKRGPVKVRVRGLIGRSDAIFSKARDIVDDLDAGTYTGPKVVCITG